VEPPPAPPQLHRTPSKPLRACLGGWRHHPAAVVAQQAHTTMNHLPADSQLRSRRGRRLPEDHASGAMHQHHWQHHESVSYDDAGLASEQRDDALPAWAAGVGGSREAALATAGPLHEDPIMQPRFKPVSSEYDAQEDEISLAAYAPAPAGRVLRRMRNSENLRFRGLYGQSVDWIPVAIIVGIVLFAWFRPWPLS